MRNERRKAPVHSGERGPQGTEPGRREVNLINDLGENGSKGRSKSK